MRRAAAVLLFVCGAAAAQSPVRCPDEAAWTVAIARINGLRAEGGVPALGIDSRLSDGAHRFAQDLAAGAVLSHHDGQQRALAERTDAAGYRFRSVAENLAQGQPDAVAAIENWMRSPEHRANLLRRDFVHLGLACALQAGGTPVWVAQFGVPARR